MSAGTISMGLDGFLPADIPDDWSEGLALLPMSKWTKSRIIEEAERSGVGEKVILTLSDMRLQDLRMSALVYDHTVKTGNLSDPSMGRWRHTQLFRLDLDWVRALEAGQ